MLKELLDNNILILNRVDNWEKAIQEAAKILVRKEIIEVGYIQAMIDSVYKNGPYMIIMPKIALAHARPSDGVKKNGISLLKLNKEVIFPEDEAVDIIIVLAAKEDNGHLELMSELAELLIDDEKTSKIRVCNSKDEIEKTLFSE